MKVAIIMGSTSDLSKVEPAAGLLKEYGVEVKVRCLSAHRAHEGLSAFINECNEDGTEVIITAAGMAAALPGVVASQTVLPVIGVPLSGSVLDGMDALMKGRTVFVIAHRLSTVRNADCIMVLDHGQIIERGTHDDLITEKGTYYRLYTGAFELE